MVLNSQCGGSTMTHAVGLQGPLRRYSVPSTGLRALPGPRSTVDPLNQCVLTNRLPGPGLVLCAASSGEGRARAESPGEEASWK